MKKPEKADPDRDVGANNSADEAVFNETLKRMLKTPPMPHDDRAKDKPQTPPDQTSTRKPRTQQS